MSKMWIIHLWTQTLMKGKVMIMLPSGKAEWDRDSDRCCHRCRGTGSDHGGRREGFAWKEFQNHHQWSQFCLTGALPCWWDLCPGGPRCGADNAREAQVRSVKAKWLEGARISTSEHDSFSILFHYWNQGRYWKWGYSSGEPRCGHQGVALLFVFSFQNLGG